MSSLIYALIDPTTSEIRYVGNTVDLKGRYRGHLINACRPGSDNNHPKNSWLLSVMQTGQLPAIMILQTAKRVEGPERERFWIGHFQSLGARLLNANHPGPAARTVAQREGAPLVIDITACPIVSPKQAAAVFLDSAEARRFADSLGLLLARPHKVITISGPGIELHMVSKRQGRFSNLEK